MTMPRSSTQTLFNNQEIVSETFDAPRVENEEGEWEPIKFKQEGLQALCPNYLKVKDKFVVFFEIKDVYCFKVLDRFDFNDQPILKHETQMIALLDTEPIQVTSMKAKGILDAYLS